MEAYLQYYLTITVLLALLMGAMTIHVLNYSEFNKRQKTWFVVTFISITFCAFAEFMVHGVPYDNRFAVPLTILTVLQFSTAPCLAMLFAGAVGLKHQWKIAIGFFAVCFLTEVICAPFGWIFKFTSEEYVRGPAFLIYEIYYFVSLIYIIVALIITGRKFHHRDFSTIIAILVVLIAGVVPMTIFKIHIAYTAVAISSCLCYVYYNDLVQQDTKAELLENQKKISDMQVQIIARLANLIENRDTETGGHVARTSEYVKVLAEDCRTEGVYADVIDDEYIEMLRVMAPIHDVGKILVSDTILKKPAKLTPEEYDEIKKHAAMGGEVAKRILTGIANDKYLQFAYDISTYHHERWDGKGYSNGLKGEEIPLSARIMALADAFDALVSKRCYKQSMPVEEAFKLIESESGTHFDPKLVEVFLKNKEKYIEIKNRIGDK